MLPYPNLVSDSTLVQDTIDLLTCAGGRAAASEIVDAVFKLSHIDDELAGLLVADLIRNDRRFKIIENNTVELLQDDSHLRLLKELDFVSDSVLVAHNAPFDTSFLNHEISRVYPGHRMVNPHLCTVRLSRRAMPDLSNHRLETIASHFSIPIASRHRAGSDALATAEIFIFLLTELEETHGIKDLGAARRFQFPELATNLH